MQFSRPVTELIPARSSIRSYASRPLPEAARARLESACLSLTQGPLGTTLRLRLLDNPWTLWGATSFLAGAARQGEHALEDYGWALEQLVLLATDLGLGTCWIGLGFPAGAFSSALGRTSSEILPAVVPVGVPLKSRTVYDRLAKLVTGAAHREAWEELFFEGSFGQPLPEGSLGLPERTALQMVRLAPSAQNRQPWRVVRTGAGPASSFHFYRQRPGGLLGSRPDWLRLDIGIAMAHFELAAAQGGLRGRWALAEPVVDSLPPRTDYVASWLPDPAP